MFSVAKPRASKLTQVHAWWTESAQGQALLEFFIALDKITPGLDTVPAGVLAFPSCGPPEIVDHDAAPEDRFKDVGNEHLLQFEYPENLCRPSTPPSPRMCIDMLKKALDRVFVEHKEEANWRFGLRCVDYLETLEDMKRIILRQRARTLHIQEDNWQAKLNRHSAEYAWVEDTLRKDAVVEQTYAHLYVDLRVWILTTVVQKEPFDMKKAVALLNTLLPPNIEDLPNKRVFKGTLVCLRATFYDAFTKIQAGVYYDKVNESDEKAGTYADVFLKSIAKSSRPYETMRKALDKYVSIVEVMLIGLPGVQEEPPETPLSTKPSELSRVISATPSAMSTTSMSSPSYRALPRHKITGKVIRTSEESSKCRSSSSLVNLANTVSNSSAHSHDGLGISGVRYQEGGDVLPDTPISQQPLLGKPYLAENMTPDMNSKWSESPEDSPVESGKGFRALNIFKRGKHKDDVPSPALNISSPAAATSTMSFRSRQYSGGAVPSPCPPPSSLSSPPAALSTQPSLSFLSREYSGGAVSSPCLPPSSMSRQYGQGIEASPCLPLLSGSRQYSGGAASSPWQPPSSSRRPMMVHVSGTTDEGELSSSMLPVLRRNHPLDRESMVTHPASMVFTPRDRGARRPTLVIETHHDIQGSPRGYSACATSPAESSLFHEPLLMPKNRLQKRNGNESPSSAGTRPATPVQRPALKTKSSFSSLFKRSGTPHPDNEQPGQADSGGQPSVSRPPLRNKGSLSSLFGRKQSVPDVTDPDARSALRHEKSMPSVLRKIRSFGSIRSSSSVYSSNPGLGTPRTPGFPPVDADGARIFTSSDFTEPFPFAGPPAEPLSVRKAAKQAEKQAKIARKIAEQADQEARIAEELRDRFIQKARVEAETAQAGLEAKRRIEAQCRAREAREAAREARRSETPSYDRADTPTPAPLNIVRAGSVEVPSLLDHPAFASQAYEPVERRATPTIGRRAESGLAPAIRFRSERVAVPFVLQSVVDGPPQYGRDRAESGAASSVRGRAVSAATSVTRDRAASGAATMTGQPADPVTPQKSNDLNPKTPDQDEKKKKTKLGKVGKWVMKNIVDGYSPGS